MSRDGREDAADAGVYSYQYYGSYDSALSEDTYTARSGGRESGEGGFAAAVAGGVAAAAPPSARSGGSGFSGGSKPSSGGGKQPRSNRSQSTQRSGGSGGSAPKPSAGEAAEAADYDYYSYGDEEGEGEGAELPPSAGRPAGSNSKASSGILSQRTASGKSGGSSARSIDRSEEGSQGAASVGPSVSEPGRAAMLRAKAGAPLDQQGLGLAAVAAEPSDYYSDYEYYSDYYAQHADNHAAQVATVAIEVKLTKPMGIIFEAIHPAEEGGIRVVQLQEGGNAAAVLRAHDVLSQLNGEPARHVPVATLMEKLKASPSPVLLTFERKVVAPAVDDAAAGAAVLATGAQGATALAPAEAALAATPLASPAVTASSQRSGAPLPTGSGYASRSASQQGPGAAPTGAPTGAAAAAAVSAAVAAASMRSASLRSASAQPYASADGGASADAAVPPPPVAVVLAREGAPQLDATTQCTARPTSLAQAPAGDAAGGALVAAAAPLQQTDPETLPPLLPLAFDADELSRVFDRAPPLEPPQLPSAVTAVFASMVHADSVAEQLRASIEQAKTDRFALLSARDATEAEAAEYRQFTPTAGLAEIGAQTERETARRREKEAELLRIKEKLIVVNSRVRKLASQQRAPLSNSMLKAVRTLGSVEISAQQGALLARQMGEDGAQRGWLAEPPQAA